MKIIHIIYDSIGNPWLGGGGAKRTHELNKRLALHHSVMVVTGNFPSAKQQVDGVHYRRLGIPGPYALSRLTFFLSAYFYVSMAKADLFIEDIGFPFPVVATARKSCVLASVQFIPNDSYIQKRGIIGLLVTVLYRKGLVFYRQFITVSEYAKRIIHQYHPQARVTVIPNGIDLPAIKKHPEKNHFLYIGRVDIVGKGLDTLVEAVVLLSKIHIPVHVIIAGTGEKRELQQLRRLIEHYHVQAAVKLVGHVTGSKKERLLRQALCVVLPSRNETFGLSALDGFAYGKPVIGSTAGGLGELLMQSRAARVFTPGDAKGLAEQMKVVIQDVSVRQGLKKNARAFAEKYSWDEIAVQYEHLLHTMRMEYES